MLQSVPVVTQEQLVTDDRLVEIFLVRATQRMFEVHGTRASIGMATKMRLQCYEVVIVTGTVGIEARDDAVRVACGEKVRHCVIHADLACQTHARVARG